MYMRPAPSDFDDWETVHGNRGWGSQDLIPLLKKAETYQPNPNHPAHGSSGPINISYASGHTNVGEELIAVGAAIGKEHGHGVTDDINAFNENSINHWAVSNFSTLAPE